MYYEMKTKFNDDLQMKNQSHTQDDYQYRRAARLLGQKLGVDWRELPREQVELYLQKLTVARPSVSRTLNDLDKK